jgi:hypothetical protein
MKYFVLQKTKYILTNSWLGLLLPAGVHQLLNFADKSSGSSIEKQQTSFRLHPAEYRLPRTNGSKAKP